MEKLLEKFEELNKNNKKIFLWIRDDDVGHCNSMLKKTINFFKDNDVPLLCCVIPKNISKDCAEYLLENNITIAQHGYSHINYSQDSSIQSELCEGRGISKVVADQLLGNKVMTELFGNNYSRVYVPPFFEIDSSIQKKLSESNAYRAFSIWSNNCISYNDVPEVNAQIDFVDWSKAEEYSGDDYIFEQFDSLLNKIIKDSNNCKFAIGIVLHHDLLNKKAFDMLSRIIEFSRKSKYIQIVDIYKAIEVVKSNFENQKEEKVYNEIQEQV